MFQSKVLRASVLVAAGFFSFLMTPACVVKIGPGSNGGAGGMTSGEPDPTPIDPPANDETDADLLAAVDPQALAFASTKATVTTSALHGTIDALPLDPASLDDATVIALMEQYAPSAAEQTDLWLASTDPSTFSAGVITKDSCIEDPGCEWHPKCKYGFDPGVSHRCIVVDCGFSKCKSCPSWVSEVLKHLAVKAWCSYVCIQTGISPPPVVAVGVAGISSLGGNFVGPVCIAP
ncbi:MAG: hypothetical protein ABI134_30675 [Byssovorax sp.]